MGFAVTRTSKSLVVPTSPTPAGETLRLSSLDRVPGLRHLVLSLHAFDGATRVEAAVGEGEVAASPARVVREALGKALVDYYPFAGRFLEPEVEGGEVRVACTGEGAWFVEAMAACSLEDVKHLDHPMVIPKEELLPEPSPDVPALDMPLMMQVTEFTCGGFVVGLISVHTIADGLGAGQFINAVGDYARGLPKPRLSPVWARDLIPDPPRMPAPPPKLELLDLREFTVDLTPDHIAKAKSDFFVSMGQRCSASPGASPTTTPSTSASSPTRATSCSPRLAGDVARWAVGGFAQDPYELRFTYDSLFVSDWTRLGFLEADYGWGAPTHVVPFSYHPFMAVAVIGAPPAPKIGARVMTMCVEEAHLPEFRDQMNAFAAGK
ncbi:unnamed protein product [Triticum turgidum subsp. durum]|uniref:Uncharacterized protein n=1 Tax=Triticum turgidum subsp. durum TaxID=4567 RepID=A0A9R0QQ38_TRITD|nr:unnamed protein product [Triticum turgidum subsp. durum]